MSTITLALLKRRGVSSTNNKLQLAISSTKAGLTDVDRILLHWFQQIEDSTEFYVVSSANTVASKESANWLLNNTKTVLELLCGDFYDLVWIRHLDVEYAKLPTRAVVMAIGRHFIRGTCASRFDATYQDVEHLVEDFPVNRELAGGWTIDAGNAKAEWVQFSGWDEVAQHRTFPKSESFREYSKIRQYVENIEVRHCVSLGCSANSSRIEEELRTA